MRLMYFFCETRQQNDRSDRLLMINQYQYHRGVDECLNCPMVAKFEGIPIPATFEDTGPFDDSTKLFT